MMRQVAILVALVGCCGTALADDMAQVGEVVVHDAWARATIGPVKNSAAYMTIEAIGDEPDRLVAVDSPLAAKAELHTHLMQDDIARMRPLEAIEIAPGTPTVLEPGGLHVMLVGLSEPLAEGDALPLTLTFENAGSVALEVPVRGLGAGMQGGHGQHDTPHEMPATN